VPAIKEKVAGAGSKSAALHGEKTKNNPKIITMHIFGVFIGNDFRWQGEALERQKK
jgi:hypothetical protein